MLNTRTQSKFINNPKDIGDMVRAMRKNAKLTQSKAAAMCGVGARFLSDLENGKPSIHLGKTLHVLKMVGLTTIIKKKELSDE